MDDTKEKEAGMKAPPENNGISNFKVKLREKKLKHDDTENPDEDKKQKKALKGTLELAEGFLNQHYELMYNTVSNKIVCKKNDDPEAEFDSLNENSIYRDLQKNNFRLSLSNLKSLLSSDFVQEYDPFREYFEELPSPSEQDMDYISKLAGYVEAKDPIRFSHHLKKHLVRAVACALEPYFFNKHAFILVGYNQNTGKTSYCRFLCPPKLKDYYTEELTTDKDGLIALSENFMINLDELATLDKQETNKLKATFSKDRVKVRHPYGTKTVSTPRRATFIGSVNDQEFLNDETGSVRWLCFEIGKIDFNYSLEIDINDVWAQAYTLYKSGYKCQLTKEEILENEMANQKFQKSSAERDMIQKYYTPGNETSFDEFMTSTEVLNDLNMMLGSGLKMTLIRIGKSLTQLGYDRTSKRHNTISVINPVYGYYIKRK
jgi:predicted P-loop ATPase